MGFKAEKNYAFRGKLMARSLPPLNWLRAFEAAARHQGFQSAAKELGVSPGAISQQVKHLENRLQVGLFERHARGVRLTQVGRTYRDALVPALDMIAEATRAVGGVDSRGVLRLVALPAIAERWLIPRLSRFHALTPDTAVRVVTVESLEQVSLDGFDVALHYETEAAPGQIATPLFRDELIPVCSPEFVAEHGIKSSADLSRCRLLYDIKWASDWSLWSKSFGHAAPDLRGEFGFSLYNMAILAAIEGQGMLIGHRRLIASELETKRLVTPFDEVVSAPHRYAAIHAAADVGRPDIERLVAWLKKEAA